MFTLHVHSTIFTHKVAVIITISGRSVIHAHYLCTKYYKSLAIYLQISDDKHHTVPRKDLQAIFAGCQR